MVNTAPGHVLDVDHLLLWASKLTGRAEPEKLAGCRDGSLALKVLETLGYHESSHELPPDEERTYLSLAAACEVAGVEWDQITLEQMRVGQEQSTRVLFTRLYQHYCKHHARQFMQKANVPQEVLKEVEAGRLRATPPPQEPRPPTNGLPIPQGGATPRDQQGETSISFYSSPAPESVSFHSASYDCEEASVRIAMRLLAGMAGPAVIEALDAREAAAVDGVPEGEDLLEELFLAIELHRMAANHLLGPLWPEGEPRREIPPGLPPRTTWEAVWKAIAEQGLLDAAASPLAPPPGGAAAAEEEGPLMGAPEALKLADALLSAYVRRAVPRDLVVRHTRRLREVGAEEYPFDSEDALQLWANAVIAAARAEVDLVMGEEGLGESALDEGLFPMLQPVEDLACDCSDGRVLCCLLHHYRPHILPIEDVRWGPPPLSPGGRGHNMALVSAACDQIGLCFPMGPQDLVYGGGPTHKLGLLAFLAGAFLRLEGIVAGDAPGDEDFDPQLGHEADAEGGGQEAAGADAGGGGGRVTVAGPAAGSPSMFRGARARSARLQPRRLRFSSKKGLARSVELASSPRLARLGELPGGSPPAAAMDVSPQVGGLPPRAGGGARSRAAGVAGGGGGGGGGGAPGSPPAVFFSLNALPVPRRRAPEEGASSAAVEDPGGVGASMPAIPPAGGGARRGGLPPGAARLDLTRGAVAAGVEEARGPAAAGGFGDDDDDGPQLGSARGGEDESAAGVGPALPEHHSRGYGEGGSGGEDDEEENGYYCDGDGGSDGGCDEYGDESLMVEDSGPVGGVVDSIADLENRLAQVVASVNRHSPRPPTEEEQGEDSPGAAAAPAEEAGEGEGGQPRQDESPPRGGAAGGEGAGAGAARRRPRRPGATGRSIQWSSGRGVGGAGAMPFTGVPEGDEEARASWVGAEGTFAAEECRALRGMISIASGASLEDPSRPHPPPEQPGSPGGRCGEEEEEEGGGPTGLSAASGGGLDESSAPGPWGEGGGGMGLGASGSDDSLVMLGESSSAHPRFHPLGQSLPHNPRAPPSGDLGGERQSGGGVPPRASPADVSISLGGEHIAAICRAAGRSEAEASGRAGAAPEGGALDATLGASFFGATSAGDGGADGEEGSLSLDGSTLATAVARGGMDSLTLDPAAAERLRSSAGRETPQLRREPAPLRPAPLLLGRSGDAPVGIGSSPSRPRSALIFARGDDDASPGGSAGSQGVSPGSIGGDPAPPMKLDVSAVPSGGEGGGGGAGMPGAVEGPTSEELDVSEVAPSAPGEVSVVGGEGDESAVAGAGRGGARRRGAGGGGEEADDLAGSRTYDDLSEQLSAAFGRDAPDPDATAETEPWAVPAEAAATPAAIPARALTPEQRVARMDLEVVRVKLEAELEWEQRRREAERQALGKEALFAYLQQKKGGGAPAGVGEAVRSHGAGAPQAAPDAWRQEPAPARAPSADLARAAPAPVARPVVAAPTPIPVGEAASSPAAPVRELSVLQQAALAVEEASHLAPPTREMSVLERAALAVEEATRAAHAPEVSLVEQASVSVRMAADASLLDPPRAAIVVEEASPAESPPPRGEPQPQPQPQRRRPPPAQPEGGEVLADAMEAVEAANAVDAAAAGTAAASSRVRLDRVQEMLDKKRQAFLEVRRKEEEDARARKDKEEARKRHFALQRANSAKEASRAAAAGEDGAPAPLRPASGRAVEPAPDAARAPKEKPKEKLLAQKQTPLFRPPARLSNRKLVRNALNHVLLAGAAREKENQTVLAALDACPADNFVILFRNDKSPLKFRGLYSCEPAEEGGRVLRLHGNGPPEISAAMALHFMKYDSGNKQFAMLDTKDFTALTCGVALWPSFSSVR